MKAPQLTHTKANPPGWEQTAKGLWRHDSGATVEDCGRTSGRYVVRARGRRTWRDTKAEAMAWALAEGKGA